MNCELVHRRLLSLERPEAPPDDVNHHLADCSACRSWHEHLVSVEREAPFLPVPPPRRRTEFLRTLSDRLTRRSRPRLFRPSLNSKRERGQRKVALTVALAASVLILALGAWLWQPTPPTNNSRVADVQPSPLEQRLQGDERWANARTARERVVVLNDLAKTVEAQALNPATSEEEVRKQVRLFQEVIDRLTAKEAPQLLKDERKDVLRPIALRLTEVESKAKRLAMQRKELAEPLNQLAFVAAEADRKLRPLFA